ncbi:MAG: amidohydrolase family protein [Ignavibacteriaceae bacterium]
MIIGINKVQSIFSVILFLFTACQQSDRYDFVIENVRLFNGEKDMGIVNVAITADTIAAISDKPLNSDSVIYGEGKYLIPGLVNAHVHLLSKDNMMKSYEHGILANLNMHTGLEDRELKWKKISRDSAGYAILYGAGSAATVPNGHPTQYSPGMETINDTMSVQQWVDNRIAHGVDYIKIIRENHPLFQYPPQPTISYEQIKEIIDYTRSKGMMVVVHISKAVDMAEIAKFKPDGFVHKWDYKNESKLTDQQWNTIRESGCFVVPTAILIPKGNEILPDGFMKEWAQSHFITEEQNIEVIKKLHEHGVMIIAGTDAPNAGLNYGDDILRELDLYKQAGMSNIEVLRTATGNTCKAFSIDVGMLKAGSKANMVLLNSNPIDNLVALRDINTIWKNGKTK